MPGRFASRPPAARDGIWMCDRFYRPPAEAHYESTVRALYASGTGPAAPTRPPPRLYSARDGCRSERAPFPFTAHDNRYQFELEGESLDGLRRRPRPCCIQRQHADTAPGLFEDNVLRPTPAERMRTTARETLPEPPVNAWREAASSVVRRRFLFEYRCPFSDGSCQHGVPLQRRCEPVSTAPVAAESDDRDAG